MHPSNIVEVSCNCLSPLLWVTDIGEGVTYSLALLYQVCFRCQAVLDHSDEIHWVVAVHLLKDNTDDQQTVVTAKTIKATIKLTIFYSIV